MFISFLIKYKYPNALYNVLFTNSLDILATNDGICLTMEVLTRKITAPFCGEIMKYLQQQFIATFIDFYSYRQEEN